MGRYPYWLDVIKYFGLRMNEVGVVNVGQESSINHKVVAWEVKH